MKSMMPETGAGKMRIAKAKKPTGVVFHPRET